MPALNKQTLINLLIDSPLREPIKINLIDIVNNTGDADLPKTFSTIAKELEIFQKATERRMKLAEETIAKLQSEGDGSATPTEATESAATTPTPTTSSAPSPTDLPSLPTPPTPSDNDGLSAPKLDLPPLPKMNNDQPVDSTPQAEASAATPTTDSSAPSSDSPPATPAAPADSSDEDALKEIQKELDALKSSATEDAGTPPATPPPAQV